MIFEAKIKYLNKLRVVIMEEIIEPEDIPKEDKTNAMVCHLLAYLSFSGIPLGGVLAPLIMWVIKKDDSQFIDE